MHNLALRPRIAAGDLVIVHEDFQNHHAVYVKPGDVFHGYWGTFPHDAMIGARFGEKMHASNRSGTSSGGYVYLLAPTAELWTASLPHRTQILYIADISTICLQLELLPGSVCVEAGTGSGSLSHALARAVGASGKLKNLPFGDCRAQCRRSHGARSHARWRPRDRRARPSRRRRRRAARRADASRAAARTARLSTRMTTCRA